VNKHRCHCYMWVESTFFLGALLRGNCLMEINSSIPLTSFLCAPLLPSLPLPLLSVQGFWFFFSDIFPSWRLLGGTSRSVRRKGAVYRKLHVDELYLFHREGFFFEYRERERETQVWHRFFAGWLIDL
jgi:hypothetical protein